MILPVLSSPSATASTGQEEKPARKSFQQIAKEKYEQFGWRVRDSGWPDFLCWRYTKDGLKVRFVEVKTRRDYPSPNQTNVLQLLSELGLPVVIFKQGEGVDDEGIEFPASASIPSCEYFLGSLERRTLDPAKSIVEEVIPETPYTMFGPEWEREMRSQWETLTLEFETALKHARAAYQQSNLSEENTDVQTPST